MWRNRPGIPILDHIKQPLSAAAAMRENHPVVQRKIDMGAMLHITADGAGRGIPYGRAMHASASPGATMTKPISFRCPIGT